MDITTQGKCEVCGNDIIMAKWVADIAQPTTCSRKCAEEKLAESREVDTVRGVKREKSSNEELTQVYIDSKKRINPVAKHFKVTWALAKDWLKEAGLIDTWNKLIQQEPTPVTEQKVKFQEIIDSVDEGKQKPDLDPQPVIESAVYDFTEQDNDPIEYVPTYILEHHLICDEIAKLLDAKRNDYGTDNIKKFGSLGCLIRASDKVERLITLRDKPANHKEDTWLDLAGYAVLGLIESRAGR